MCEFPVQFYLHVDFLQSKVIRHRYLFFDSLDRRSVEFDSLSILRLWFFFLFLFLQIFFQPVQPTCFRVLMTVHCISANFYIGENDFLLRGDTCHGLTSTRVSWPLGVTRNRSRAQRSYPIPVQRQHLSRDMDVLRANQEWLSFFSPRIATSKLRPIRSCGDNDRMYAILPIIRFAIDSIPIEGEILVIDEILRMEVEFSKG